MPVRELFGGCEDLLQFGRDDEVAYAPHWRERLGDCAEIDDSPVVLEAVQRWNRIDVVAIFAVVVVLDHIGVVVPRPFQKLMAACDRHDAAQRKLMRWRDIGQFCPDPRQQLRLHPALVDGDRDGRGTRTGKDLTCHPIARVLDDEAVGGIDKQASAQIEALLRTVDDDDLLEVAAQGSGAPEIALERLTQPARAARVVIGKTQRALRHRLVHRAFPDQCREIRRSQVAIAEIDL